MPVRRLAVAVLALLVTACSNDSNGVDNEVVSIAIQGGDNQDGAAGSILALPIQVKITDPANDPVRGVAVIFRPATGTGVTLSDTVVTTGTDGVAGVTVRVGTQLGEYTIARAFVRGTPSDSVTFRAEVTPGPGLTSVTPTTVQAGDTVTITGTGFNTVAGGNEVLFGTARALVTSSTSTEIRAVVPPCVTPGTVAVRVVVGTAATPSTNVTYTGSAFALNLAVNEGITVSGSLVSDCLVLPGDGAGYLIVPQFATGVSLPTTGFQVGNSASPLVSQGAGQTLDALVRQQAAKSAQSRFDLALRAYERTLPAPRLVDVTQPPALEALTLNSQRTFRVLCSIQVGENCFQTVTARLKYIGNNVLIYMDNAAPAAGFSDAELQAFGNVFDQTLYPIDVQVFGAESDIDNNDRVIMLLTPVVNALVDASECAQFGSVLGFFFGFDLSSTSSNSNKGEIFYGFVPDPQGVHSCVHSKETVARVLPGTFIHEFQHMINYNQHVLVRGGSQETDWLNEGLSHLAEELAARHYERKFPPPTGRTNPNQIFPDSANPFIIEQLANSYEYLFDTRVQSLTLFETDECCEGRGAAWLFMRWLGDQQDSTVYRRLVQTSLTSVANVENATGRSFASLMGDFGIGVYVDSLPGVPRAAIPDQYRFTSRNLRYLYDALHRAASGAFPRPFPIVPTALGHTQQLSSSMEPGTSAYYELATPPGSGTVSIRFAPAGGSFDPLLNAQVGIYRLR
ncbi:MAG TPA: IPT/TIG domain-containing protein [Gemmatimonadaceae bacterium]|nr:IPT/TIG domain-containing protein [Gemmatimonadaceae bacterium]